MKQKILLPVIITSLISYRSWSQNSVHLSLQNAIATVTSNNDAVKLSALDVQIAIAKFRETQSVFLPQATIFYSSVTTNNPLNAFGFKLQQRSITEADFNPKLL